MAAPATLGTTLIARRTRVRGDVDAPADLVVEGRIEGNVRCAGVVTVAASGVVLGEIRAHSAEIAGIVVGDLVIDVNVEVLAGARLVGDLRAPMVSIAAGANIEGRVDHAPEAAPVEDEPPEPRVAIRARAPIARLTAPRARATTATGLGRPRAPTADPLPSGPPPLPRLPTRVRLRTR